MHATASSFILSLLCIASTFTCVFADLRLDGGEVGWDMNKWRTQVDGVMGGDSSGSLRFDDFNTIMSFSGDIELDGGGFSSVRKQNFNPIDLTPYAGIVVQLETTEAYSSSDIQPPLGLHLQLGDTSTSYGFAASFAIPLASKVGEGTSVFLPLSSFDRGTRIGFQCSNCQLDFSSVNEMDIYVLFQSGTFNVRVRAITAVDTPQSFPSPVISIASANDVKGLIQSTIQSGGKLYDYDYFELCIAVYRSTLNTLLRSDNDAVVSKVIRGMICQGFQLAESQVNSKTDTAWTLRYTLDGIIEELGFSDPGQGSGWRPDVTMSESFADRCSGVTSAFPGELVVVPDMTPLDNDMINEEWNEEDAEINIATGLTESSSFTRCMSYLVIVAVVSFAFVNIKC